MKTHSIIFISTPQTLIHWLLYAEFNYRNQCREIIENATVTLHILKTIWHVNSWRPSRVVPRWVPCWPMNLAIGASHHRFRWWLHTYRSPAPSHYLNLGWFIDIRILGSTLLWNLNQNTIILCQKHAFENVVCKIVAILSLHQYVKKINNRQQT